MNPWHEGFADAEMVTLTGRVCPSVTIMVMEFELTGFTRVQMALDVIWQVTTSPSEGM